MLLACFRWAVVLGGGGGKEKWEIKEKGRERKITEEVRKTKKKKIKEGKKRK